MPWLAIPYDNPVRKSLYEKLEIDGIPTLILLDKNGKILTKDAKKDVTSNGPDAIIKYIK